MHIPVNSITMEDTSLCDDTSLITGQEEDQNRFIIDNSTNGVLVTFAGSVLMAVVISLALWGALVHYISRPIKLRNSKSEHRKKMLELLTETVTESIKKGNRIDREDIKRPYYPYMNRLQMGNYPPNKIRQKIKFPHKSTRITDYKIPLIRPNNFRASEQFDYNKHMERLDLVKKQNQEQLHKKRTKITSEPNIYYKRQKFLPMEATNPTFNYVPNRKHIGHGSSIESMKDRKNMKQNENMQDIEENKSKYEVKYPYNYEIPLKSSITSSQATTKVEAYPNNDPYYYEVPLHYLYPKPNQINETDDKSDFYFQPKNATNLKSTKNHKVNSNETTTILPKKDTEKLKNKLNNYPVPILPILAEIREIVDRVQMFPNDYGVAINVKKKTV